MSVTYTDKDGNTQVGEYDKLIVAIGRVPNSANLGAEAVGLKIDGRGFVEVDEHCRTSLADVYAIGDVVRGPMLAHKSSEEGCRGRRNDRRAIRTHQPGNGPLGDLHIAGNRLGGQDRAGVEAKGIEYRAGQFPFIVNGRARAIGETAGFVKMLADAKTDRILGVHMIGPYASELISEAVVAMEFGASCRGHRPHRARPSDSGGSHARSGTRGGQAHDQSLMGQPAQANDPQSFADHAHEAAQSHGFPPILPSSGWSGISSGCMTN